MESMRVYPKNKKQRDLLKNLFEELKIRFEEDDPEMDKEAYFAKLDKSVEQSKQGKTRKISKSEQKELLEL